MKQFFSLVIICLLYSVCYSQTGTLDSSFGENGKILTKFYGEVSKSSVQHDDKILVISNSNGFTTIRYLPDGSIDKSFGKDGFVNTSGPQFTYATPCSVIELNDKKIIAGGSTGNILLTKYLADGTPDSSFGNNGLSEADFGQIETAFDVKVQDDGKIVTTGYITKQRYEPVYLLVCRFMPDGSVDKTFGENGKTIIQDYEDSRGNSIVIQKDNKIVIGGHTGL